VIGLAIKNQEVNTEETEGAESKSASKEEKGKAKSESRQIESLEKELDLERAKSSDLANRKRYLQADIANVQRQSDRKVSEVRNQVKLTWILEVLSIKEDLDRAIGIGQKTSEKSTLLDGLMLVSSRIENILKLESVEVIRANVGGRFDPTVHEALAFQESDAEEQGTILAVISPGYLVEGKVIKPAMVEVSRPRERKGIQEPDSLAAQDLGEELEIEETTTRKKS